MSAALNHSPRPTPFPQPQPASPGVPSYTHRRDWAMATYHLEEDDAGLLLALGLSDHDIGIASAVIWLGFGPLTIGHLLRDGIPSEHWVACMVAYRELAQRALAT